MAATGIAPLVIVDYGVGNLRSIQNMLARCDIAATISGERDVLRNAARLVLPGVGHFRYGMESLRERGIADVLDERVLAAGVPVLGICLGAQMLGRHSAEGDAAGLGWVPMDVVPFDRARLTHGEKVPHMGWSETRIGDCALFDGLGTNPRFYYVHSYHFRCERPDIEICSALHGYPIASGVRYRNILGVQFHPEKSLRHGQQVLRNFARMEF